MTLSYSEIDSRAQSFYAKLAETGIPIHPESAESLIHSLSAKSAELLIAVARCIGYQPNPYDVDDYAAVAFRYGETLPLTAHGRVETSEKVVNDFEDRCPELRNLSEARKINRRVTTVKTLLAQARGNASREGRHVVHPEYLIRSELARVCAKGVNPQTFTAKERSIVREPGRFIVDVDYDRIELYVLAGLSQDSVMRADLESGDFYLRAAMGFYELSKMSEVTVSQRQMAKTLVLSMIYGMSPKNLAASWNLLSGGRKWRIYDANKKRSNWAKRYHLAWAFLQKQKYAVKSVSFYGRIRKRDASLRRAANDRTIMNAAIQNTAADYAKIGFFNMGDDPRLAKLQARLITTVHDSIVFSVPDRTDMDVLSDICQDNLCHDRFEENGFSVPVSLRYGESWGSIS